jgi:heme-degrading monooxygenase HmoA
MTFPYKQRQGDDTMVYIHVQHTVEDFDRWKAAFDAHASTREAGGGTGKDQVLRDTEKPNQLTVILEWDELDKARQFAQSQELREAMQNAGVTGPPTVHFLKPAK